MNRNKKVIFLHHSTGKNILVGKTNKYWYKLTKQGDVMRWLSKYNRNSSTKIELTERFFPREEPYGWKNYPFDYYNIWVKHGGLDPYMGEPTLEMLTKEYDVIVFKHCFPGSNILADMATPAADNEEKWLGNYKEQYLLLRDKLHQFPHTKFIIWTLAALTEKATTPENARRAKEFCKWLKEDWNEKGDNIYIFDFNELGTQGGLYLKPEFARSENDSHPNEIFSAKVAPEFCQRIVDVINDIE